MTERKRERVCGACRYGAGIGYYMNSIELVTCRRRAPTPDGAKVQGQRAFWPLVEGDAWCGEYTAK